MTHPADRGGDQPRRLRGWVALLLMVGCVSGHPASAAVSLTNVRPAAVGQVAEWRLAGVPAVSNPFDADAVRLDVVFTGPSGRTWRMPAFWFQDYRRALNGGAEVLTAVGAPEWRVRFTALEAGSHSAVATLRLGSGAPEVSAPLQFEALTGDATPFVAVGTNRQYLVTADARPLPLVGHCVCWHQSRGTYDYDTWLGSMAAVGENYTRLWMAPWAFGIENPGRPLRQYALDRAWQLDQVFRSAEAHGIHLLLCLDYHGMFESEPDYWGGNNHWPQNPYNQTQGGPCATPNAFFTNATARIAYQHRLRYLVGRYGASPRLLAWQFFNEIDNVYRYFQPADVAVWHAALGAWLKQEDPYRHLVTTSFGGGGDRPEIWSLPEMDFVVCHSYNQADPTLSLGAWVRSLSTRYAKPVLVGEFGLNWQGWNTTDDPWRRGWRQGVWTGLLSGSAGTSMSWWWEHIHAENLYPQYRTIREFVDRTRLGSGRWEPLSLAQPTVPPATVGEAISGAAPFTARLALNSQWGATLRGTLGVADPETAVESEGLFNGFVHGTAHPELRLPFRLHLWCGTNATLTLHLNSVSDGAVMRVLVDNVTRWSQPVSNRDGTWQVNNEYNTNFTVNLPEGRHLVEVRNAGGDWFFLDWVELVGVLPASYAEGWAPALVATGIRGPAESLVYVANPRLKYPARVTDAALAPVQGRTLTLSNWPAATFGAEWFDARTGAALGRTRAAADLGTLALPLPEFSEDIVGRIVEAPRLSLQSNTGQLMLTATAATGLQWLLEQSDDLTHWTTAGTGTVDGTGLDWVRPIDGPRAFYRAGVR